MTVTATVDPVKHAYQTWRRRAYEVGAHIEGCDVCHPRPGQQPKRGTCAGYDRADAAESAAWDAYERARKDAA